jgi:hypothetical protein
LQPLQTSHSSSGDATCAFDTLGIAVAIGTLGAREQSTACQWCTAVHRSTICGCKPVAYRCEQGAPDALKHGCFPATPVTSLKITGGTAAPPVWVDLTALEFVSTLQYRGGGEPSDTAAAGALKHVHEMNYSGPGAHAGVQLMLLSEAALQRCLSISLREKRVLDMQLREDVRQAAHPPTQPGALIASCPICSYGTDLTILDPLETTASCSGVRGLAPHLLRPTMVRPWNCLTHAAWLSAVILLSSCQSCLVEV